MDTTQQPKPALHDTNQESEGQTLSELEQQFTSFAQDYARSTGALLLREVRIASTLGNGFQVRKDRPFIFVGNRTDPDHIVPVLKRATQAALEMDCPDGQYLLHDGKELLILESTV